MKKILATAAVTLFLMTATSGFAQSGSQGGGESGTSSGTSRGSDALGVEDSSNSEGKAARSGSMTTEEKDREMRAIDRQKAGQGREPDGRGGSIDEKRRSNIDNSNATGSPEQQPSTNMQGTGNSGTGGSGSTGK